MDGRGIHVVYGIFTSGSADETHYQLWNGTNWIDEKNVTDYDQYEEGGNPTITTSANRVHVSYNTGTYGYFGDAKTRDYNYQGEEWEEPQIVFGGESGQSLGEKVFVVGSTLHMFYYEKVSGEGQYHTDIYHTKRSVGGSSWDSPTLIDEFADVEHKIEAAKTDNGNLHIVYPSSGLQYRSYNGSWSSEQLISENTSIYPYTMFFAGNDLYCFYKEVGGTSYVKYRQYDASPLIPANTAIGASNQVTVSWSYNPEPDIQHVEVWRKYYRNDFDQEDWTLKATRTTNSWTDNDFQLSALGDEYTVYYKFRAKDNEDQLSVYSSQISTVAVMVFWKNGNQISQKIPREFNLEQNYPNPFNPSTTIDYAIPEAGNVTITVFDHLGREVASVINKEQNAGYYSATFDASKLSSGTYFYKISVGKYSATKKMLLLK